MFGKDLNNILKLKYVLYSETDIFVRFGAGIW